MRLLAITLLSLTLTPSAALGADSRTRTYAGGFSSRWHTVGPHGHDQPWCGDPVETRPGPGIIIVEAPDCNTMDFGRGNLDNSIGFRVGRERDWLRRGRLSLVGGLETSVSYTEYNLTQRDFALFSGALTAGFDVKLWGARFGGRYGTGPFGTSDGQEFGFQEYTEGALTLPLRDGVAVRISHRHTSVISRWQDDRLTTLGHAVNAGETALLFVSSPHDGAGESRWEFASSTGATYPGVGPGSGRKLRKSAYNRLSVFRDLDWHRTQLELAWTSSAQESMLPTNFLGYDGNFRSKTIDSFGLALRQTLPLGNRITVSYGAGVEVADWRDDHHLLARNWEGEPLDAGVEFAYTARAAVRFHAARHIALELTADHAYWQMIDLGEFRWGVGLVLTR